MAKKKTNVAVVTVAIFIATFMTAIEGTIVSTAMPTIVGTLHGVHLMNWIVSIYLLTNAMATPIYGKLADRMGRKPVFMMGLAIFITGSLLSGLSQSMEMLIVFRAIQGVGAGAIMPVTFTIIADIYPLEKRAKVLGFNGSAWGIASVVAPLLGGFIVDQLSWHWIFIINVPIGLITMGLVFFFLHEDFQKKEEAIDTKGTLWLLMTLLLVMYGFQSLAGANGVVIFVITLLAAAGFFWLFVRQEKRAADPIIDLKLFENRTFVVHNLIAALVAGFVIGFEVYMPMWMQGVLGLEASMGGFVITPSSLMWIVGSFVSGVLIARMRPQRVLWVALGFLLVGSLILSVVPETTPYWFFLVVAAVLGFGFGITITTTTVAAQAVVAKDQVGVATSFNTLSRTLGQTLMVSIYGIVLNISMANGVQAHPATNLNMMNKLINPQTATELPAHLLPTLREILYTGLHHIYFFSVVIIILAMVVNMFDHQQLNQD
ncbi:MDR family MFS transporter [Lacticaseibacillus brantae]|uniref:Major facilitator superfamily permease n=1 Tax=Lacticaseibacillus brantae DSM 23927 TaxID=1423727 RepID=A0A0R2AZC8_9LACO|nr:MDR family MFS transporter [Lacticaseibacillus brantae]KRM72303.1 major facilitator superfamily permease [Lacticaseibacillus brantae DSM 23927]